MLHHRGPDGSGTFISNDKKLFLGHRRLKIIDLSESSAQPMKTPDGRWTLIYNGEIVNYRELRQEVGSFWTWQSLGDTELLLALWARQGSACLDKIVGMFAFAIFDNKNQELYLVRDRFGIKPLYWCDLPCGGFAFASEIPALLTKLSTVLPDEATIRTYLELGLYDHSERTFFKNIQSLPPGTFLKLKLGTSSRQHQRWYDFAAKIPDLTSLHAEEIEKETERLIQQAVFSHLVSDVEVGLNVSGGVDSSMLVRFALEKLGKAHLFNQDYVGYSELPWIKEIAAGGILHVASLNSDHIYDKIQETVAAQAEPFGGIFVCGYNYLYKAAKEHLVTVLLDGNGVDEAFLGYRRYHQIYVFAALDPCEKKKRSREFTQFWGQPPEPLSPRAAIDGTDGLQPKAVSAVLKKNTLLETSKKLGLACPVRDAAAEDLLLSKIPRGLRFNDRVSMAHSRELRVPFLDHRLVEFAFGIPAPLLLNEKGSKAIFRKLLSRTTPNSVAFARKRSVQSPQREWLASEWRPFFESILFSKSFRERNWLQTEKCTELYKSYLNGKRENSFFLWQWLNLELWARKFLD